MNSTNAARRKLSEHLIPVRVLGLGSLTTRQPRELPHGHGLPTARPGFTTSTDEPRREPSAGREGTGRILHELASMH
jgi:hypothetical protein